jgi:hypothetical protein
MIVMELIATEMPSKSLFLMENGIVGFASVI